MSTTPDNYKTLFNNTGASVAHGLLVRASGNNGFLLAQADQSGHVAGFVGVNGSGIVGAGGPANIFSSGGSIDVLLDTGLTPVAGGPVYVSSATAGRGTTLAPTIDVLVGIIEDASKYVATGIVTVALSISTATSSSSSVTGIFTDSINTTGVKLSAYDTSGFVVSSAYQAFVGTVGDYFAFRRGSALPTDGITVITASGTVGAQWVRLGITNIGLASQITWTIDPQNSTGLASDENSGLNAGAPLFTFSEHARRLVSAYIKAQVNVTVLGDQVSTDVPFYSYDIADALTLGGGMIFTFPLTTALYSGTISAYTEGAAAPNFDAGDQLTDAGIPVSFTASGLLATGILFKRTSGAAAYWWGAWDLGAKTLRCSRPCNIGGTAKVTLAIGNTYSAYVLAKLFVIRFSTTQASNATQFFNFNLEAPISYPKPTSIVFNHTCVSVGNFMGVGTWVNPWFVGSITFEAFAAPGTVQFFFGGIKTGTTALIGAGDFQWNGRITVEAGSLLVETGAFMQLIGVDLAFYDCTAKIGFLVEYWAIVLFVGGGICGSNNTFATPIVCLKMSQITYTAGALCVAGSFSNGTPILLGNTAIAVAGLPSNQVGTLGMGIYQTQ